MFLQQHSLKLKHWSFTHSEVCLYNSLVSASLFEGSQQRFEKKLHLVWKNYLCNYFEHLA